MQRGRSYAVLGVAVAVLLLACADNEAPAGDEADDQAALPMAADGQPAPSCNMCPATLVPAEEIQAYFDKALRDNSLDQQVRAVDAGKANVTVAVVHRDSADAGAAAEHSLVTEVYYVVSGTGTHQTGPELIDATARGTTNYAAQWLNGPGHAAPGIRNPEQQVLKEGDVLIIPAGTGHQFIDIPDHITYVMVRIDPDKVVPLMDEAMSRAYLETGVRPGETAPPAQ